MCVIPDTLHQIRRAHISSEYTHQANDSDRTVVINRKELVGTDLVVDWGSNREDNDDSWLDDALNRGDLQLSHNTQINLGSGVGRK